jgi:alkylation response protein AidB-like acyl-CoA dehydrogenase
MLDEPITQSSVPLGVSFELTEEQKQFQELAHDFAENEIRPVAPRYDEAEEFPWEVIQKAHQLGLMTYAIPEAYGGAGVTSAFTGALVSEELAWGCAGIATAMGGTGLCAAPILLAGNEAQKIKYLGRLADTHRLHLGAYAITEPDAGSDAAALKTAAKKVDGGYVLNGTKHFITNGGLADVYTTFATLDPTKGADGICAFIVEKDFPGVKGGKKERKMGIRASHTAQVHFENVFVPGENRLGEEGEGFLIAMKTFEHTRPDVAALAVGVARAAFEYALDYSMQREQFGRQIAKFQAIGFMLADMATEIDAARLLTWRAAWMLDRGRPVNKEASMAKAFAADTAMKVTTDALQILGGVGYTRDYPVEKWMRDAKIMQIYEGTSQINRLVISRMLIGF